MQLAHPHLATFSVSVCPQPDVASFIAITFFLLVCLASSFDEQAMAPEDFVSFRVFVDTLPLEALVFDNPPFPLSTHSPQPAGKNEIRGVSINPIKTILFPSEECVGM